MRRLKERGADVRVVMTAGAQEFITPLTLQAVSGEDVRTGLFDLDAEAAMGHIELARWADKIIIAPASADFIARFTVGMANDLLTTLCLATDKPIYLAPAMNRLMWADAATQANIQTLQQRGVSILGPGSGEQACGEVGAGRMLEPLEIIDGSTLPTIAPLLAGKRLLITAGPTQEAIDPVRYISNHSSGKMGYAIASAAAHMGAEVTLVSGPTVLAKPPVRCIEVLSAAEMLAACEAQVDGKDVFIATAAVADYRVDQAADQKIKKNAASLSLGLQRNPDILATISAANPSLFTVGFAAETNDVLAYARDKLQRKQLNMIAANEVGAGKAFGQDDNAITLVTAEAEIDLGRASKQVLAFKLLTEIAQSISNEQ